jgi:ABC-type multidrug transport system permease subunit
MKLLTSIRRELTLLSRSVYFYSEIAMAVICLLVLLVLMPENFDSRATEYIFIDMPPVQSAAMEEALFSGAKAPEEVTLNHRGNEVPARLYTTDMKYVYMLNSRDDLIVLCEDTGCIGTVLRDSNGKPAYEYYLQGNETERYMDYTTLLLSANLGEILEAAEKQVVKALEDKPRVLTDRQSVLPLMLSVNCVLMGILVAAAFIVEDKKTKVIKALRVVPSRIGVYLTAKITAVILMALATTLIISAPVMLADANYLTLCLTVICGGFFTISIGVLLASFFDDIGKAFSSVYVLLIVLMIPGILGMMPAVSVSWVRFIPSYYVVQSVKESLLNRDAAYVLLCCAGFAAGGLILSFISIKRYQAVGIGVGG